MSNSLFDGYYYPQFHTIAGQKHTNSPENYEFKHKLRELETVMFGPDSDDYADTEIDSWRLIIEAIPKPPKRDLKWVLISCAKAISEQNITLAESLIHDLRQMVSVSGEPIQRLSAYLLEGLVARLSSSGSSIYKSLKSKESTTATKDVSSYMNVLYEVCPYIKFGYMSANGAIAEATKNAKQIHIIDFHIAHGNQWITLIKAFAARPTGPPSIRITGITSKEEDPTKSFLIGKRLTRLAKSVKVQFKFESILDISKIVTKSNETIAVNFAFVLHKIPECEAKAILAAVKNLSPRVVTMVEQELNTGTTTFFPRFVETLDYYSSMFESIDGMLTRDDIERVELEQYCLAKEVVNVIACEGVDRVERNELIGKWKMRFRMVGFRSCGLSSLVNERIGRLLRNYGDEYRVEERDDVLFLGWNHRNLVASSAWM